MDTGMIDIYLRADTEADMIAALPWARGEAGWITGGDGWALDVIGPVVTSPGEYDEDGTEIVAPVVDGRFHANLRLAAPGAVPDVPDDVIVSPEPQSPTRRWG